MAAIGLKEAVGIGLALVAARGANQTQAQQPIVVQLPPAPQIPATLANVAKANGKKGSGVNWNAAGAAAGTGAAIGASIGTAVPVVGTAIGGAVGATVGFIGGLFWG